MQSAVSNSCLLLLGFYVYLFCLQAARVALRELDGLAQLGVAAALPVVTRRWSREVYHVIGSRLGRSDLLPVAVFMEHYTYMLTIGLVVAGESVVGG